MKRYLMSECRATHVSFGPWGAQLHASYAFITRSILSTSLCSRFLINKHSSYYLLWQLQISLSLCLFCDRIEQLSVRTSFCLFLYLCLCLCVFYLWNWRTSKYLAFVIFLNAYLGLKIVAFFLNFMKWKQTQN